MIEMRPPRPHRIPGQNEQRRRADALALVAEGSVRSYPSWIAELKRKSPASSIDRRRYAYEHIRPGEALELVREPDPGFCDQLYQWASGKPLEEVLEDGDMSAGDFVRSTKQVWDLLRQLADVAPEPLSGRCRDAARAIYRGVVAYSGAL